MPMLLPDINHCTHDLGRILFLSPEKWTIYMQITGTKVVSSFLSSYTAYKLLFVAIPDNSVTMDARCFQMWTRYRDVRFLWEHLADAHKKLQIRGSFPSFPLGVIFRNKSPEVINERQTSITSFLNYAVSHPVLRQTKALQDFLERALESSDPLDHTAPLVPTPSRQPIISTKDAATCSDDIDRILDEEFEVLDKDSVQVATPFESKPSLDSKEKACRKHASKKDDGYKYGLKKGWCTMEANLQPFASTSSTPTPSNTVATSTSSSSPKPEKEPTKTAVKTISSSSAVEQVINGTPSLALKQMIRNMSSSTLNQVINNTPSTSKNIAANTPCSWSSAMNSIETTPQFFEKMASSCGLRMNLTRRTSNTRFEGPRPVLSPEQQYSNETNDSTFSRSPTIRPVSFPENHF